MGSFVKREKPAFCASSRAFGSPIAAPIPAPPCASDLVMNDVEGRNEIEAALRQVAAVCCFEGNAIGDPGSLRVAARSVDRFGVDIETGDARLWKALRDQDRCAPAAASDVSGSATRTQRFDHLRHRGYPFAHKLMAVARERIAFGGLEESDRRSEEHTSEL